MSSATPGTDPPQRPRAAPLTWRVARLVTRRAETPTAQTLVLSVPGWPGHRPGQHLDLRLTAADGYQAARSYSLAAPADRDRIEVTVQRVPDGEVSPYLVETYAPGDPVEVRGPVGGWFVWDPGCPEPVLLVAGGSGLVPLMAMLRARSAAGSRAPFRLIYSVRSPAEALYAGELADRARTEPGVAVSTVYTRQVPPGWAGPPHRVGRADLAEFGWPPQAEPRCYVCGPTGFVESVADLLVGLGHPAGRVRTERFGPTG
ncbi:ferredoxin reductase [Micromonospora fluostatini]|uniref:ferredoxin reductase n=1 Tax=Micromonospora sp. JCM 30529 TaxID=3421643 RepID=UPI003D17C10C